MEADVKRFGIGVVACLITVGCGKDPARNVKIAAPPPPTTTASPSVSPAKPAVPDPDPPRPTDSIVHRAPTPGLVLPPHDAAWRPDGCPPPPEDGSGPDLFTVTGPCKFEHRTPVACESLADDFLMTMSRPGAHGSTVMVYINVEHYSGPGNYDGTQMFVGVQDKTNIYRWSSDDMKITVGAGEAFAVVPATTLTAEPLLVQCTGPMNNYQCAARKEATAIEGTVEVVSGTLRCGKGMQ